MPVKLHYFNPGHEAAILTASPYYMPPANVLLMQKELAYLPAWGANSDDYVFLSDNQDLSFFKHINQVIGKVATAISPELLNTIPPQIRLQPWGLSPQVVHFCQNINNEYNIDLQIPRWNSRLSHLSSRHFAKGCLQSLCPIIPEISESLIPVFVNKLEDIEDIVTKSKNKLLAKAPFSSSGRGLLWLPFQQLTRTERQILHGILKKQGSVSIESVLNKKIDFAMEFFISEEGSVNFEGYSYFNTNIKGAYTGNLLASQSDIQLKIFHYINIDLLERVKTGLYNLIKDSFTGIYSGYIGIDMMIYEENEEFKLHPCVEINVRNNMGVISLGIVRNYLSKDSTGFFHIEFNTKDEVTYSLHEKMLKQYPAQFENGKLKSGYFSLCPVSPKTKYRAYILAEEKI